MYSILKNGIYKLNLNDDNEIVANNQTLLTLTEHAYLLDYDAIENDLYFAECAKPLRLILMTCPKTKGIFRVRLNQSVTRKEVRSSSIM